MEATQEARRTDAPRGTKPGAALLAAILLPALLFAALLRHDMRERDHRIADAMEFSIRVAAEQAQRLIDGGVTALDRAEDATAGLTWAQVQARRTPLQGEFHRLEEAQSRLVSGLALARPDGRIVVSDTAPGPAPDAPRLGAAAILRPAPRGTLFFEPPPPEGFGADGGLLISRPRLPDGRPFDGILTVALREEPFLRAWATATRGLPDARLALVRDDGTILLPSSALGAGRIELPPEAERHPAEGRPPSGDPFAVGVPQFLRSHRLGDLPASLVLTVPTAPHEREAVIAAGKVATGCFFAGLVIALLAILVRDRMRADTGLVRSLEAKAAELAAEIARRETAEEGLRNAQRMEAVGRLTGGVAHDFNNLLTAILGTARALERHLGPTADTRTRRLLAATIAAVDRGARLNASLLAFARRQPLTLAAIDTNALVQDFLPLLRRALGEAITVELSLDERLPPCKADAAQVESALLNLAINARDAMPRGGVLRIVTRRAWLQEQALAGNPDATPGPYVAVEVRDNGLGMSPEARERAFEPFFTTKPEGQGTGLGLSQIFGFMRQIGGHVALQSVAGRGTTVTLYLPLGTGMEGGAVRFEAPPNQAPMLGRGASVLVVEDEPTVRAVAVELLADAGFDVRSAEDGPTALALLKDGVEADILFTDVVMPGGMSGVELAREARRLRPRIVVLLASGYAAEALDQHGGAAEFELINKPYDTEALLSRLAALRRPRYAPA